MIHRWMTSCTLPDAAEQPKSEQPPTWADSAGRTYLDGRVTSNNGRPGYDPDVVAASGVTDAERLRRIEAVTDATLSRLDVADLFDELLDRVRELLRVDTAAILLLDVHAQQLVATAAKGLEEEVRRAFRLSIGRGFAGRIALTRRPVIIEHVTAHQVVNPVLLQTGVKSDRKSVV